MFNEYLSDKYRIYTNGGSKGTQIKYQRDGMWYKEDNIGCEGDIEYLVSILFKYSSLNKSDYVIYDTGLINNRRGCRSKDFTDNGRYVFYTLQRLYEQITGLSLYEKVKSMDSFESRRDFVLDFFNKYYKFDLYEYLSKVFSLDLITLNEDRHFNNLGVCLDTCVGKFCNAPIFDNGMSLLNGNFSVMRSWDISENVNRVTSKPFSGSPLRQYNLFSHGFYIDYIGLFDELDKVEIADKFYKDVFYYQLLRYRDKFFKYSLVGLTCDGESIGTRIYSCGNTYDIKRIINTGISDCIELKYIDNEYISEEEIDTGIRVKEISTEIFDILF